MEPRCPYYNNCGSCTLQDVDYEKQLSDKRQVIEDATNYHDVKVFSGNMYNYRNRMDMPFHRGGLGFRRRGKWWDIIDVAQCSISNERLNALMAEVRDFFGGEDYFDVRRKAGTFRYAVIRTPGNDSSISFVLNQDSGRLGEAEEKIIAFAGRTSARNILIALVPKNTDVSISANYKVMKGDAMLAGICMGREFLFHAQGFFQNNDELATMMNEYCHELLKNHDTAGAHLVDLYGGVGTFGINNSDLFKGVTIIENNDVSIEAAKKNIERNEVSNVKALLLNAKRLREVELPGKTCIIADPARDGLHPKAIKHMNTLRPYLIVYVSCNAKRLKEDLALLEGYSIKSAAMFDFFPQTRHIESVIELILDN